MCNDNLLRNELPETSEKKRRHFLSGEQRLDYMNALVPHLTRDFEYTHTHTSSLYIPRRGCFFLSFFLSSRRRRLVAFLWLVCIVYNIQSVFRLEYFSSRVYSVCVYSYSIINVIYLHFPIIYPHSTLVARGSVTFSKRSRYGEREAKLTELEKAKPPTTKKKKSCAAHTHISFPSAHFRLSFAARARLGPVRRTLISRRHIHRDDATEHAIASFGVVVVVVVCI